MPENGAKTVADWRPKQGCRILYRRIFGGGYWFTVSWVRPLIRGLSRIEIFEVHGYSPEDLDRQVDEEIEKILHADSLKLLARGRRTQRADTEHFEAAQKGLTVTYFSRDLLIDSSSQLEQYLIKGEPCPI